MDFLVIIGLIFAFVVMSNRSNNSSGVSEPPPVKNKQPTTKAPKRQESNPPTPVAADKEGTYRGQPIRPPVQKSPPPTVKPSPKPKPSKVSPVVSKTSFGGSVYQLSCVACGNTFDQRVLSNAGILCKSCASQGLFRKRLIITGITRMNKGHVCVSGIDYKTGRFVRPVYQYGLDRDFVMQGTSQVVRHFNIVDFEFKAYRPSNEFHTEDWIISERFAPKYVGHAKDETVIKVLQKWSISNLSEAIDRKNKSLFIVKASKIDRIWDEFTYDKFKVRMNFTDAAGNQYERIPVTDLLVLSFIRYHKNRGNHQYGAQMMQKFNSNPFRFIRIGLTREFQGQHWKQVTALMTVPDMFDGASFADYERKIGGQA